MVRSSIILLFLLSVSCRVFSQQGTWFALSDFGHLVNVEHIDVDVSGNCFVGGRFQGEAAFQGAHEGDSVISDYTSEHSSRTFVAKYTAGGQVDFVATFSGSDTYLKALKCLRNGDVLLAVYVYRWEFNFIQPGGEVYNERLKSGLIRVNSKGKLVWHKSFPVKDRPWLEEDDRGNLYLFTDDRERGNQSTLFLLDPSGNERTKISFGSLSVFDMKLHGKKLWLVLKSYFDDQSKSLLTKDEVGLFSINYNEKILTPTKHFSCLLDTKKHVLTILNTERGDIRVDMLVPMDHETFTFFGKPFNRVDGDALILKVDERGHLIRSLQLKGVSYYNVGLHAGKKGETYFHTPVHDRISFSNNMIEAESHSEYVHEVVYFKFDKNYNLKWYVKGGGTASNYHRTFVKPYRDYQYFVSDLLDYGKFNGIHREVKWMVGYYVFKVKD